MSYDSLIKNLGFTRDPFATTNADEEDFLEDYFIEPPFFKAVYGQLDNPKSSVVFAPRGGGKTALKRKIEIASKSSPFVCVTYNSFPTDGLRLSSITHDYHLKNISRLLLIALIGVASEYEPERLSGKERHILFLLVKLYLTDIDSTLLKSSISSVQSLSDKARAWWNRCTGPVGLVLNAVFTKLGLGHAEIKQLEEANGKLGQASDHISFLAELAVKYGYKSVYILIDKVDENNLTGKVSASFEFIRPIIIDLPLLETKHIAFKFFLWDKLADEYREVARPDRVKYYELKWSDDQLKAMLSKRLEAHSGRKVSSLTSICGLEEDVDLDRIVVAFSSGSPRNIIRACKEILDQQSEVDSNVKKISTHAVIKGFEVFSENYSIELYRNVVTDIQKLKRTNFLLRHVYADVFKVTQAAGLAKVRKWQELGAVEQIGTIQEIRGSRPSNHYAVANPFLLKYVFSDIPLFDLWRKKIRFCQCDQMLLRDWDASPKQRCHSCQREIDDTFVEKPDAPVFVKKPLLKPAKT